MDSGTGTRNEPRRGPVAGCGVGCLLLLLLAACSRPDEATLDAFDSQVRADPAPPLEARSLRMTVPLGPPAAAGMPGRRLAATRTVVVLAGEPGILEALGGRLEQGFEDQSPEHDLRLRPATSRTAVGLTLTGQAEAAVLLGDLSSAERERGMEQSQVGRWILALYVHPDVPLQPLTRAQVRDLFTGRVQEWPTVGGGRGEVRLVLPRSEAAAELAARLLTAGEALAEKALAASDPDSAAVLLRSSPGSLGVLPLPLVADRAGLRQVVVEGSRPGAASGWPYAPKVYLATPGPPSGPATALASLLRALLDAE